MTKTAGAGEAIYAQTVFPVTAGDQMAIPPGTYVQGQVDFLTRPGFLSPHAHFQIHFTKIIFANGYSVELPESRKMKTASAPAAAASTAASNGSSSSDYVLAAVADTYVQVSAASDVLLDNGSQIEMIFQRPLRLNAARVADAVSHSNPATLPEFKSATQCQPTPGTPGSPGTPPTIIPGADGAPPTVIPGIPATPGTPPTVISGFPGSPGVACPAPPVVESNPKALKYKESFQVTAPVSVSGKQLAAGQYQVTWQGTGPMENVEFLLKGKVVATARARVVFLSGKSSANALSTRPGSAGSTTLRSLQIKGQAFGLFFSQGGA
jgi:hypothetical protein